MTLEEAGQGAVRPENNQSRSGGGGGGGRKNVFGDDDNEKKNLENGDDARRKEIKELVAGQVLDADKTSEEGGIEVRTCVEPELAAAWTAKKNGKVVWIQGAIDRQNKVKAQKVNRLIGSEAKRSGTGK